MQSAYSKNRGQRWALVQTDASNVAFISQSGLLHRLPPYTLDDKYSRDRVYAIKINIGLLCFVLLWLYSSVFFCLFVFNLSDISNHITQDCSKGRGTETEMSSFWWNSHHWLHWKLSKWQFPVQPVMKILSKWHFHLSGGIRKIDTLCLVSECLLLSIWENIDLS